MTYKIEENPPPLPTGRNGPLKGELQLTLESMVPGNGLRVLDKRPAGMGPFLQRARAVTGHGFKSRADGDGCYVWCIAAEPKA